MLMSATDPAKITELDKWLKANQKLKGTQLQDAAVKAGFDASFVALVALPSSRREDGGADRVDDGPGAAFTSDRSAVFASIQKLRQQAKNVGTLKSSPQQEVETKTTSAGQEVIVIEPTNPQIVYVPQYNTEVVYTQAPTTTVVIVQEDDDDADEAIAAGLIGFTAGIAIGAAMDNNYYYGPYGWHGGGYMYNDAWDDYYDHREDAREDWMDHREDLVEERGDRAENRAEQRTERAEHDPGAAHRPSGDTGRKTDRSRRRNGRRRRDAAQTQAQGATTPERTHTRTTHDTAESHRKHRSARLRRRKPRLSATPTQRSSGSSDAFSGYSSGASQRSSSARGQTKPQQLALRGGGGGRRR